MKIRGPAFAIAVGLAVGFGVAGCGEDKCPTESPQVTTVGNCSAIAGQTVNYPLRLCPTCNQTISECDVQISGGTIFLNPTVEACSNASSCPPACNASASTCSFTAPAGSSFQVQVFDPGSNQTKVGTLTIVTDSPSCALPSST